jgi:hypothetical protein
MTWGLYNGYLNTLFKGPLGEGLALRNLTEKRAWGCAGQFCGCVLALVTHQQTIRPDTITGRTRLSLAFIFHFTCSDSDGSYQFLAYRPIPWWLEWTQERCVATASSTGDLAGDGSTAGFPQIGRGEGQDRRLCAPLID